MGSLGGLLGTAGGVNGTGIAPPTTTAISNPTNTGQINNAYSGVNNSMQSQQALLQAIQQQQGLQKQNSVYNQLQGVTNGTGPNPAQAMLNQGTGQNVANQAAMMAGQRGAAGNVGLMTRQAAQQGAATQQQAVGQGAVLQANQSLNALNQQGGMANQIANNQIGQTNANTQAQQAEQQQLLGANQGFQSNQVASQNSVNAANAGIATTGMQGQQSAIGGLLGGASSVGKLFAGGGDVGPQSKFGQFLKGASASMAPAEQPSYNYGNPGADQLARGVSSAVQSLYSPSPAPALSPYAGGFGDQLPTVMNAAKGGVAKDYRGGGNVKADGKSQKAVAPGNNYSNDKIPAMVSENEIIVPRNITMGPDPVNDSAKFVASVLAKRRGGK